MGLQDWHPALRFVVNLLRWIPVVFIFGVVCWSYYAYVVELCIFIVDNLPEKVAYMILYHIVLVVFLWSYYQTIFSRMMAPPSYFKLPSNEFMAFQVASKGQQNEILEKFSENLPIVTRSYGEGVRYCNKCRALKPDRAHHCAVCGLCLLKMDHHCPWVNTCVHWGNYKFFILFLGYALVYCLYIFFTDMRFFIETWRQDFAGGLARQKGRMQILFLFFVAGMFAVSVGCLFFYHLWLVAKNRSTVEACYAPVFRYGSDKDGFNLGVRQNFRQVFGEMSLAAFLPVFTSTGDGIVYPTRRGAGAAQILNAPVFDYKAVDGSDGHADQGQGGGGSFYGKKPEPYNNNNSNRKTLEGSRGPSPKSGYHETDQYQGDGHSTLGQQQYGYGLDREFKLNGVIVSGPPLKNNESANNKDPFNVYDRPNGYVCGNGNGYGTTTGRGINGKGLQRRTGPPSDPLCRYAYTPMSMVVDEQQEGASSGDDDSQDELPGHTYHLV